MASLQLQLIFMMTKYRISRGIARSRGLGFWFSNRMINLYSICLITLAGEGRTSQAWVYIPMEQCFRQKMMYHAARILDRASTKTLCKLFTRYRRISGKQFIINPLGSLYAYLCTEAYGWRKYLVIWRGLVRKLASGSFGPNRNLPGECGKISLPCE